MSPQNPEPVKCGVTAGVMGVGRQGPWGQGVAPGSCRRLGVGLLRPPYEAQHWSLEQTFGVPWASDLTLPLASHQEPQAIPAIPATGLYLHVKDHKGRKRVWANV